MPTELTKHIENGPDKWELATAYFQPFLEGKRCVVFMISNESGEGRPTPLTVELTLILAEDGSGDSWLFEGYITGARRRRIHGLYSTKNKQGWYAQGKKYLAN